MVYSGSTPKVPWRYEAVLQLSVNIHLTICHNSPLRFCSVLLLLTILMSLDCDFQVDNLSELLRELQMLRVTREVQAVISNGQPGRADAGVPTFHPAAQELQTLENLMKHNDRY